MSPEKPEYGDLVKRLGRERKARREAEAIAERVTGDLFGALNEVKRINLELETLNQSLRDFVAIASHDLRGPLTSVMGFISTLRKNWTRLAEEQKLESLEIAERQAQHLGHLVEDLLTISRIESGGLDTHKKVVAVNKAVMDAVQGFRQRAAGLAISISEDVSVIADPDHVRRIIVNFIENAFKYGEPPIELKAIDHDEKLVEIRVSDRGDGIPLEFLPRLFQKFARAANADSKGRGTGLGLSIVKGLAEANGGSVRYEPNQPSGSCFIVSLPRAAA